MLGRLFSLEPESNNPEHHSNLHSNTFNMKMYVWKYISSWLAMLVILVIKLNQRSLHSIIANKQKGWSVLTVQQ